MSGFRSGGSHATSLFFEVLDGFSSIPVATGLTEGVLTRGGLSLTGGVVNATKFFPTGTGTHTPTDLGNGIIGYRIAGGGVGAFSGIGTGQLTAPIRQTRSVAPILSATLLKNYRYTYTLTAFRIVGAVGIFSVKLGSDLFPSTGAFQRAGFGLEVTGSGNWHAIRRVRDAVAIVDDLDTGLTCTAPRRIELIYTSGSVPKLDAKIDGATVLEASGDANMISLTETSISGSQLAVANEGAALVDNDWCAYASYKVEQVA